jgi:DNA-binding NarL/FixJ family response regulator
VSGRIHGSTCVPGRLITRCSAERSGAVLVFSDIASPAVRQRCLRLGADGVISKGEFAQLRSYLQAFPGSVRAQEAA